MGEKSDSLYRPEIDGLRAIAVLAVVLFHAGVPYIDGGFLGVDVFFVISGFLITAIIRREVAAGTFSVGSFYERRAKRIIPALGVVLLACLPFAWLWMLPTELEGFSESVVATIFFVSNFFFWQGTDYFATAGEVKPLLHTWSLAVEEQYYALYPLFALGLLRFGSRVFAVGIVVALLMSLGFSEWAWRYAPDANFYLLPSRAWELLAGGLATFVATSRSRYVNDLLAFLGLVTILAAIALFGAATPFPSLWGLLPVAGTCLVLAFSSRSSVTGYVLSLPPLVLIGGLSYSLYLWHQPVFAFARIRLLGEPSWQMMVCLLALCFLLSLLSWRLVENPVRAVQLKLPQMRTLFAASLVVLLLPSLLFSAGGIATSGYIARVPAGQLEILGLAGESYRKQRALDSNFQARRSCFADFNETAAKFTSACVPSSGRTGVMI